MSDHAFGTHAVAAALEAGSARVKRVLVEGRAKDRHTAILKQAESAGVRVALVDRAMLDRLCPHGRHHQGIAAELAPFAYATLADALARFPIGARTAVLLDGVTDPHNVGAILRSAGAFGNAFVVLPKDRSADVTPVVLKVAAGAAEQVPIVREANLVRVCEKLKEDGFWCWALDAAGETAIADADLSGDCALILGSEGHGLRPIMKRAADALVRIPIGGSVASLNVAAAAACAMYEAARRRAQSGKRP
ncbi:23S rRNA (guanosine(2251)-2'-O)-methyltransferase RlmB [bacterium]|nr:23S rRNA (guanosine(2251)-2'-O)-methyltransferase RlmB [bacterium]